jgi:hypothetical protein
MDGSTSSPNDEAVSPSRIMDVCFGYWKSKILMTAVDLDIFTILDPTPLTLDELTQQLKVKSRRGLNDLLDSLVAMQFLRRDSEDRYSNTPESAQFLNKANSSYMGTIIEYFGQRFKYWHTLTDGIRTANPQSEVKTYKGRFSDHLEL